MSSFESQRFNYQLGLLHKSNDQKFQIDGSWTKSLESIDDVSKLCFGRLSHNNDNCLEVFNSPIPSPQHAYFALKEGHNEIPRVSLWGIPKNDNTLYFSFSNAFIVQSPFLALSKCHSYKSYADYFLVENFNPKEAKEFNTIYLDFNCFSRLKDPLQKIETHKNKDSLQWKVKRSKSFTLGKNICTVNFPDGLNLFLQDAVNEVNFHNKKLLVNYPLISIETKARFSVAQALDLSKSLQNYFMILSGSFVTNKLLELKNSDDLRDKCDIFYRQQLPEFAPNDHLFRSIEFIKSNIKYSISNWVQLYEKDSQFKLLCIDYLQTIKFNLSIENKLIVLIEGIESYFEGRKVKSLSSNEFIKKKHLFLIDKLKIFEHLLPSKIKSKLEEIFKKQGVNNWLYRLKATRVFYAHGYDSSKRIRDFPELIKSVDLLQLMVQIFILQILIGSNKMDLTLALSSMDQIENQIIF